MPVSCCRVVPVLILCALGGGLFTQGTAWAGDRFVQDRFVISFWVDPPVDENADQRYREIADANFTMVLGGFGTTPASVPKMLRLCKKYGLKAVVPTYDQDPGKLPGGSTCWGYTVRDEPSTRDFPALKERVDALRKAHPGKLAYINLFPNYVSKEGMGADSYEEYVSRFIKEVGVDVLSMDYYPQFKPGTDGRDGYCGNLEVMRKQSLEANIPFWNFFNIMPYGPHTDPTEAQLRWQIYSSVAYGAKGVLYFCYYTPAGGEFPKGGAIIARNNQKTRHYDQAKRINFELKNLGDTLMKLTNTAVVRVKPDSNVKEVLAGSPIKNLRGADYDPKPDYLVGVFRHQDGRRAVLLNNYQFAYTAWPTVEFDTETSKVLEVSKVDGQAHPVVDDSPDIEGLQLSLDAGEGRLFLLP